MVEKRRFERIYIAIEGMTYTKYDDIPENQEIIVYGFEHVETDKVDKFILVGCSTDEFYENDKLFNFWSNKVMDKEIEKRKFKTTGWYFMTLVERKNFFKPRALFVIECGVALFLIYNRSFLRKLFI